MKSTLMAAVAALAIGSASVATPASAFQRFGGHSFGGHPFGGHYYGGHGYGYGGWHHGYGGWGWGPAIGLGLVAGAIAGGAYYDSCYRYQPMYDQFGNYVGRQLVNVCY
jgi:hypothetical protein